MQHTFIVFIRSLDICYIVFISNDTHCVGIEITVCCFIVFIFLSYSKFNMFYVCGMKGTTNLYFTVQLSVVRDRRCIFNFSGY